MGGIVLPERQPDVYRVERNVVGVGQPPCASVPGSGLNNSNATTVDFTVQVLSQFPKAQAGEQSEVGEQQGRHKEALR